MTQVLARCFLLYTSQLTKPTPRAIRTKSARGKVVEVNRPSSDSCKPHRCKAVRFFLEFVPFNAIYPLFRIFEFFRRAPNCLAWFPGTPELKLPTSWRARLVGVRLGFQLGFIVLAFKKHKWHHGLGSGLQRLGLDGHGFRGEGWGRFIRYARAV